MRRRLREKQEKRKQGKRICAMFLLVLTVISGGGNVLPVRAESTEVELVEHQDAEKLAFDREDGAMSKTNMEGMVAEADDRQIGYDLEMEDTESEVAYTEEELQAAENEKSRADIDSQAATVEEGTGAGVARRDKYAGTEHVGSQVMAVAGSTTIGCVLPGRILSWAHG